MVFEGFRCGFMRFSLHEGIQNNIILDVGHAAGGDALGLSSSLGDDESFPHDRSSISPTPLAFFAPPSFYFPGRSWPNLPSRRPERGRERRIFSYLNQS